MELCRTILSPQATGGHSRWVNLSTTNMVTMVPTMHVMSRQMSMYFFRAEV